MWCIIGFTLAVIIFVEYFLLAPPANRSSIATPTIMGTVFIPTLTPTATITSIPTILPTNIQTTSTTILDNIPTPINYGNCYPTKKIRCPYSSSLQDALTMVIYNEGGLLNLEAGPNILQVIHNRVIGAWTCSIRGRKCSVNELKNINPMKIPFEGIEQDQFNRLILYTLARPYTGNPSTGGYEFPAFNAWDMPLKWSVIQRNPRELKLYNAIYDMVARYLVAGIGDYEPEIYITDPYDSNHTVAPSVSVVENNCQYFELMKGNLWTLNRPKDIQVYLTIPADMGDGEVYNLVFASRVWNQDSLDYFEITPFP